MENQKFCRTEEEYIAHCQQHFSVPGLIDIHGGDGGLPFVTLRNPAGATEAKICLHGAVVTSWRRADGQELLFLREENAFDGETPIAGGIGIAWPQMGTGQLPLHGFLRNLHWSVVESSSIEGAEDPRPSVTLYADHHDCPDTMQWGQGFEALYTVSLEQVDPPAPSDKDMAKLTDRLIEFAAAPPELQQRLVDSAYKKAEKQASEKGQAPVSVLRCKLSIRNKGDDELAFTAGLLTHLATLDIEDNKKFVKILGLYGKYVLDYSNDPMRPKLDVERDDFVFFNPKSGHNMDKLYVDCDSKGQVLFCPGSQSYLDIRHVDDGFRDIEVMNPAATAPDVARQCVCVASARRSRPVRLRPGELWKGEVKFMAHGEYWPLPPCEKEDPSTIPMPPKEEILPPKFSTESTADFTYDDDELSGYPR